VWGAVADRRQQQVHVVAACYLGWMLDAFDYFIMAFALDAVAAEFHSTRTVVAWAFTLTLAMRPVGAFFFGRVADRFGRRPTLMANVLIYAGLECASGFAPSLTSFLILRALFGVAMGGEWGVGASLTMESIPTAWRGPVSGLLQAGYPSGYLLATLVNGAAFASIGWRGMFMLGVMPALLVLYIRRNVPESPAWAARQAEAARANLLVVLGRNLRLSIYCIALMAAFNFFSHGTQDLYKSFLAVDRHLPASSVTAILAVMNLAAMCGGIACGALSQRFGRRRMIIVAALLSLPALPLWAFATGTLWIGVGAMVMQLCVQGAWGVIPAHLNELSPADVRATFPGLIYQLGNLVASSNANIQSGMADSFFGGNLAWPMALVVGGVAVVIVLLAVFGPEARQVSMGQAGQD
jgi:SHS family lactate transporter-like MFS transporter